jgi:hypothetical protein
MLIKGMPPQKPSIIGAFAAGPDGGIFIAGAAFAAGAEFAGGWAAFVPGAFILLLVIENKQDHHI